MLHESKDSKNHGANLFKPTHRYVCPAAGGRDYLVQDLGPADLCHRRVVTKDGFIFYAGFAFLNRLKDDDNAKNES